VKRRGIDPLVALILVGLLLVVAYLVWSARNPVEGSVEPVADDSAAWCEAAVMNEYQGGRVAVRNMQAPSRWAWSVCPELASAAVTDVSGVPSRMPR
jgi:hypothetical protein